MEETRKSILIEEKLHKELKDMSKLSGISIKHIVEMGIVLILKRIQVHDEEE